MKRSVVIVLILLTMTVFGFSESYTYSGTRNAGNFLKIPIGARVEALAGSYIGIADDLECINSNPAGLALEDRYLFGATFGDYYLDLSYNFFGVMIPTEMMGNIAFSAVYLDYGTQEEYDVNGSLLGEFTSYDAAATLSIADYVFPGLYAGFNARYIETKLQEYKGGTVSGDIGLLWNPKFYRNIFLGAVIKNFGMSMKVDEMANELPITYGVGIGFYPVRTLQHRLLFSLDYEKAEDTEDLFKVGAEYFMFRSVAFRLGMETSEFNEKQLSYGLGLTRWNIGLNYSMSSHEELENIQKISIHYAF